MKEIRALTGLRGIAALIVFLTHTRDTLAGRGLQIDVPALLERLVFRGGPQVDIFFVLSGFILTLIYRDNFRDCVTASSWIEFQQRRLARIYPLHLFMLLLVLAFVMLARLTGAYVINGLDRFTLSSLPAHLLLVHAWGFLPGNGTWNPPSWSISIEFLAYLLFPFFLHFVTGFATRRALAFFFMVVAAGLLANWATPWGLTGFAGIARGLSEFALGCATVYLMAGRLATFLRGTLGGIAALSLLAAAFSLTPDIGFAIGLAAAPLLLALTGDSLVSAFFGNRVIYFLGEISYSVYMAHFLFSSIAYRLISIQWMQTGTVQLLLGLTGIVAFVLLVSTATYYGIERPGRDLLRRFAAVGASKRAVS
ncbi:MAG: acyltransferase [Steroidobacteraceae bacterium]